ncbi:Muscle-specific homeobox protein [Schistosoma japonicum]|uniref:Muscle-specific homeobox protein n=1 Tax=Schistosoma japonicum TaxID=6182 RepID=A0A4Z2CSZ7_SCHJA|nr:Muscle-specific homeobox protein [Schistosoma japonicum]
MAIKKEEILFHSDMKSTMDCDISTNNISDYTVQNESVLDLSLVPNSSESSPQYTMKNSHLQCGLTNCTPVYTDIPYMRGYNSFEQNAKMISSSHASYYIGDSNMTLPSGNYIPNIPTPEQLLTSSEELLVVYTVNFIFKGQINFINLFRQTWHSYQQYLVQPNYVVQTMYPSKDDYQYYVHNNQSVFTTSQLPNTHYDETHPHNKVSECQMETSLDSIPNTKEDNILVSNHSKPPTSTDKTDSIGYESASDKPRQYRKARAYFHPRQMNCLESFFQKNPYLSTRDREYLSRKLNLSEDRIRTWFQNRRMREKRKPGIQYDSDDSSVNSFVKVDYS